jgi:hypothetical protein
MSFTTVNPTNEQTAALKLLAQMVASCATFAAAAAVNGLVPTPEQLLGEDGDELKCIHYPWYRLPTQQVEKPFAVIYEEPGSFNYRRLADGVQIPNGKLRLQIGLTVNDPDDAEGESVRFNNFQGDVASHLRYRSQIPGELRCTLEQSVPPTISHPAHVAALSAQKPFWFTEYTVTWDPLG